MVPNCGFYNPVAACKPAASEERQKIVPKGGLTLWKAEGLRVALAEVGKLGLGKAKSVPTNLVILETVR